MRSFISCLTLTLITMTACAPSSDKNPESEASEWINLFDGESFDGWKGYNSETIPEKWEIEEGLIIVSREGDARDKNTGFSTSIMTEEIFDNFEFELEYRMSEGGNSGIMYHVQESPDFGQDYITGPEYQLLDDVDSPSESAPHRLTAALYDMYPPNENKSLNPFGEWNTAKIVVQGKDVEHWLNGVKVLEYTIDSEDFNERRANSKWAQADSWAAYDSGHISLQDHGDKVEFKNIRIKKL